MSIKHSIIMLQLRINADLYLALQHGDAVAIA